jgi:hypothetical protein
MIRRKIPWTRQPQYPVDADRSGPFAQGLEFLHNPGISLFDAASKYNLTTTSYTAGSQPTTDGMARYSSANDPTSKCVFTRGISFAANQSLTMVVRIMPDPADSQGALLSLRDGTSGTPIISIDYGANGIANIASQVLCIARDDSGSLCYDNASTGLTLNDGKFHTVALRRHGGNWASSIDGSDWHNLDINPTNAQGAITITDPSAMCYFSDPQNTGGIGGLKGHLSFGALWKGRGLDISEIRQIHRNPWQLFQPLSRSIYAASSATSATLTGTISGSNEGDIVTGGKTIILTLTGDTWIAAGTGPIGSTANTQALIDGIDSAQAEATGWDAVVKAGLSTSAVVRTSSTVATITLPAFATYDITATETITATIPAAVLTLAAPIVAAPTFTVTATTAGGWLNRGYWWSQTYGNLAR